MSKRPSLLIEHARQNNLKDLTIEIPHDALVVLTGLSGSGKSSLAFDTVYAEGQRRYIETFSTYTRQFFDKVQKPDLDRIENVRPAIAIQQRTRVHNARSTVGSMTNINDYLKILWSNLAKPVCPSCGVDFESNDGEKISRFIEKRGKIRSDSTFLICAAVPLEKLDKIKAAGYARHFSIKSGSILDIEDRPDSNDKILVVVDRCKGTGINLKRLKESSEQAFLLGEDSLVVIELRPDRHAGAAHLILGEEKRRSAAGVQQYEFQRQFGCSLSGVKISVPKPSLFSYNHPAGACPECKGFGKILRVSAALCVPDENLSIKEGALQCWNGKAASGQRTKLAKFCEKEKIPLDLPWYKLTAKQKESLFNHKSAQFRGVLPWFARLERKIYKMHVRVFLSRFRAELICPSCAGNRLKREAQAFRIKGKTISEIWRLQLSELTDWLHEVKAEKGSSIPRELADTLQEILTRLYYLRDLGLSYLTLERQARTLSGGETQRVNLAGALGSELVSTQFVLDEPSVGLHPRDTERLLTSIRLLHNRGNSVMMVEHDLDCIAAADQIIELGPQAGKCGGEVVWNGAQASWPGIKITLPTPVKKIKSDGPKLSIRNANIRNLKNINIDIPLQAFVCLSGVSGSGKSTLVNQILKRAYDAQSIRSDQEIPEVSGFENIDKLLLVDQSPLSKTPRANIATYSKIWDEVRDALASTDKAKELSFSRSYFSFNVDAGRCPSCKGAGALREEMQFLSDVFVRCETCLGKRFLPAVLEVRFKGKNCDEILNLSVQEVLELFPEGSKAYTAAEILCELGVGHLRLGHPLSELSGGEAQRLKLVPYIAESSGKTLLIFDEPTTGLHLHDVENLIRLLRKLCQRGHTVLCVEHNLSLILASDWIIDLGPEGGADGGRVLKEGTPHQFLNDSNGASYTARYLKEYVKRAAESVQRMKSSVSSSQPALNRAMPLEVLETKSKKEVAAEVKSLEIKGAREHNLKNLDLKIPLNKVVALTGVSGSGKSTIAKDIIYAEGQRRYLDCLSPYARQFIEELKKPDIESIKNIAPTICVYQHTYQPGHLSTVATMSEIYNFLRLLYAKLGEQFCPKHPQERISPLSTEEIAKRVKSVGVPSLRVLAPVIKMKKGEHKAVFERARALEITEVRVDGSFAPPRLFEEGLSKGKPHNIDFVVGRFNPKTMDLAVIQDCTTQAIALGAGTLVVHTANSETIYSTERTCSKCQTGFFKPDPEDLSFNSKRGACKSCSGRGVVESGVVCADCNGARINAIGRNIRLNGLNIFEATKLKAAALKLFLETLKFDTHMSALAAPVLRELFARLDTLLNFGLDYIGLERSCSSLSNGELQRLRLATAIGSPLSGVIYIFDEPSVGLHPTENAKVLAKLHDLKASNNSVIIIEHDAQAIMSADHVVEIGPGGGGHGGQIVFNDNISKFKKSSTLTARAMREELNVEAATPAKVSESLTIKNGSANNIVNLNISLPLNQLLVVRGVSGAGKSSLVHSIIADTISLGKVKKEGRAWIHNNCEVGSSIELARVLYVDQKPIGISSRSTPASYLGVWDEVRKIFANTVEAKSRGWGNGFFSYNTGKGRCSVCKGLGIIRLEMSFLADAESICESCGGVRFGDDANSVRYLGINISEALALTFEEAKLKFANHRRIYHSLHLACELGLGYLALGQSSASLSGGEAQRLKLVTELDSTAAGHTLYVLDEPSTGLHKLDVAKLIRTLRQLVAKGNSVIVIEHDEDIIAHADYIVEMGPGAGEQGGRIVYHGTHKHKGETKHDSMAAG